MTDAPRSWLARLQDALATLEPDDAAAPADPLAELAAAIAHDEPPPDGAATSKKRMAFVLAYVKDPRSRPAFADKAAVYEVVAAERAHQQGLATAARERLAALPPPGAAMGLSDAEIAADPRYAALEAERAALERAAAKAEAVQTQLFALLKELTGATGRRTGGTGILAVPGGGEPSLDALLAQAARKIPPKPRP